MAEEKVQTGSSTATEEKPKENLVRITFMPEGRTVEFEHGKLPYQHHGKPGSILDVAMNNDVIGETTGVWWLCLTLPVLFVPNVLFFGCLLS